MKLVHRPVGAGDGAERLAELRTALDAEGIAPGEPFLVERVGELPGGVGPFQRDSDTSRLAALENYPRAGSQRHRVLRYLSASPVGATRDELALALGLPHQAVTPRVWELVRGGWVRETTDTRPTQFGCEAHVLELTEKGAGYQEVAGAA